MQEQTQCHCNGKEKIPRNKWMAHIVLHQPVNISSLWW